MKALKSHLAKKLLADPKVGDQLSKVPTSGQDGRVIYVRDASGRIIQQYRAIVVPKAA